MSYEHVAKSFYFILQILFCTWVFSWAAVPTVCLINGHIFELPSDRIERLTSYVYMMSATFVIGK